MFLAWHTNPDWIQSSLTSGIISISSSSHSQLDCSVWWCCSIALASKFAHLISFTCWWLLFAHGFSSLLLSFLHCAHAHPGLKPRGFVCTTSSLHILDLLKKQIVKCSPRVTYFIWVHCYSKSEKGETHWTVKDTRWKGNNINMNRDKRLGYMSHNN